MSVPTTTTTATITYLQATGNADYLAKAERLFDGCCHKFDVKGNDYNWDDQVCVDVFGRGDRSDWCVCV